MQVLLIEDNPDDALLVREWLSGNASADINLLLAQHLGGGLELMRHNHVDLVLLDLSLPDSTGLGTLMKARQSMEEIPIIVLTGANDEAMGIRAVHHGAQDYLIKNQTSGHLLLRSMVYAVERKRSEAALKTALREKEVLLKEVHHRVKNNLQLISSLLNLQGGVSDHPGAQTVFNDLKRRVQSMAMLHELLFRAKDLSGIDMAEYLKSVAQGVVRSYNHARGHVHLRVEAEPGLHLGVDVATPCGLIVNELVSNCLKHAFPGERSGTVHVHLSHHRTECRLIVRDDGVGFPEDIDFHNTPSLGLQLVCTLVRQLGGRMVLSRESGTEFAIRFPTTSLIAKNMTP